MRDPALVTEQEAWQKEHPDSPILLANLAAYAQDHGKMRDAERLFDEMERAFSRLGAPPAGAHIRRGVAHAYIELGEQELGRKNLHRGPPDMELEPLLALAETGDQTTARAMLARQSPCWPGSR